MQHLQYYNKANINTRISVSVFRTMKMAILKSGWNLHTHDSPLQTAIWLVVLVAPLIT